MHGFDSYSTWIHRSLARSAGAPAFHRGSPLDILVIGSLGFLRHRDVLYVRLLCPFKKGIR